VLAQLDCDKTPRGCRVMVTVMVASEKSLHGSVGDPWVTRGCPWHGGVLRLSPSVAFLSLILSDKDYLANISDLIK
jgi:hypothetical protein